MSFINIFRRISFQITSRLIQSPDSIFFSSYCQCDPLKSWCTISQRHVLNIIFLETVCLVTLISRKSWVAHSALYKVYDSCTGAVFFTENRTSPRRFLYDSRRRIMLWDDSIKLPTRGDSCEVHSSAILALHCVFKLYWYLRNRVWIDNSHGNSLEYRPRGRTKWIPNVTSMLYLTTMLLKIYWKRK